MMESLSQEARVITVSHSGKQVLQTKTGSSSPAETDQNSLPGKLRIREAVSWAICFAVVAGITGALMGYRIGVTMYNVTSILFYISLLGLLAFIAKLIHIKRVEQAAD